MSERVFRSDKDWRALDGQVCLVTAFTALAEITGGRVSAKRGVPYAEIVIEPERSRGVATAYITHRDDFACLWRAFMERGVGEEEEVIVVWNRSGLRKSVKLVSRFMPKLVVWICPKGAFELMTDQTFRPELTGMTRHHAMAPIVEWKPNVMD